jgi:hypothetical protein
MAGAAVITVTKVRRRRFGVWIPEERIIEAARIAAAIEADWIAGIDVSHVGVIGRRKIARLARDRTWTGHHRALVDHIHLAR